MPSPPYASMLNRTAGSDGVTCSSPSLSKGFFHRVPQGAPRRGDNFTSLFQVPRPFIQSVKSTLLTLRVATPLGAPRQEPLISAERSFGRSFRFGGGQFGAKFFAKFAAKFSQNFRACFAGTFRAKTLQQNFSPKFARLCTANLEKFHGKTS